MQLTKYKLGDLIAQRREKNKGYDLPIRGVSRDGFIKPKVEEADTSIYNVFYKNDFVFNPARMELNSIALNLELDKALCSSLYEVFYVKDENVVLPEFLNLHIKRDEFARHCDYIGLGSAREYCRFANIAEFDIKIPSIEVQREIVQADRQIKRRIRLNEQMIEKLEATAQALYRKMFVDGIDKENLPEGWRMGTLGEVASFKYGKLAEKHAKSEEFPYPVYSGYAVTGYTNEYTLKERTIVIIARGDAGTGRICMSPSQCFLSNLAISIEMKDNAYRDYMYYQLLDSDTMSLRSGSAQAQITITNVEPFDVMIPKREVCVDFQQNVETLYNNKLIKEQENFKLSELQSLLLAKMGNLKQ